MSDQLDAYNQIKEENMSVSIIFDKGKISNPVEEEFETYDDQSYSTYGIRTNFKEEVVDGSLIKSGDCKLIIPGYGLDDLNLKQNYKKCSVSFSGETWRVIDLKPLSPIGVDLIYTLHIRK